MLKNMKKYLQDMGEIIRKWCKRETFLHGAAYKVYGIMLVLLIGICGLVYLNGTQDVNLSNESGLNVQSLEERLTSTQNQLKIVENRLAMIEKKDQIDAQRLARINAKIKKEVDAQLELAENK